MKHTLILALLLSILIIAFALWDSYIIRKHGNLKGFKKVYHIGLLWLSLALAIGIYHKFQISDMLYSIPLAIMLIWVVKDITMGLRSTTVMAWWERIIYLGSGKFDRIWKKFPGGLVLLFKLILLGFGIHFYYWHV